MSISISEVKKAVKYSNQRNKYYDLHQEKNQLSENLSILKSMRAEQNAKNLTRRTFINPNQLIIASE